MAGPWVLRSAARGVSEPRTTATVWNVPNSTAQGPAEEPSAAPIDPPQVTSIYQDPETEEYEVDRIVDVRKVRLSRRVHGLEYLVLWKGWSMDAATWEPESNLTNCKAKLNTFKRSTKPRQLQLYWRVSRAPTGHIQPSAGHLLSD